MLRFRAPLPAFLGLLAIWILVRPSQGGLNGGGTLLAHDAALVYTVDLGGDLCGMGDFPASCETADTRVDGTFGPGEPPTVVPKVWKVYAAFIEGSTPRLKGVSFGVSYDEAELALQAYGACIGDSAGGARETRFGNWPGSGAGTSLVFQFTRTTPLVECYWFAGYSTSGNPSLFRLVPHPDPDAPGGFVDDGVPAIRDAILGFGSIGLGMNGEPACPEPDAPGACCILQEGTCSIVTPLECAALAPSSFLGGPSCDPNPCPTAGPCCIVASGLCEVKSRDDCRNEGNLPVGVTGQDCSEEPGVSCGAELLGACCSGQTCTVTTQPECAEPDIWVQHQPCFPGGQNPCLLEWGACCIDSQCYIRNADTCPAPSRFYPGLRCDPDGGPCVVPVRQTTWGAIKQTYR